MLPYKLDTTNDLLTDRAGLLVTDKVMDTLNGLHEPFWANRQTLPRLKSNRGTCPLNSSRPSS